MEAVAIQKRALTFACEGCGSPMVFDAERQALRCRSCGGERAIEASDAAPLERELDCGIGADAGVPSDWGVATQTIRCGSCGGESVIPAVETAAVCAFCGSPKVLVGEAHAGIAPETIVPFQVTKAAAADRFETWKKRRWFVPGAFKRATVAAKLIGVYVPYWTFDAETYSSYKAQRGDYHYRTETRTRVVDGKTETYEEQVRYTSWTSVSGAYDCAFDDVLIPASARYERKVLNKVDEFELSGLRAYRPEYLSGFAAEKYTVGLQDGWRQAVAAMAREIESDVRRKIGGDEISGLSIRTRYGDRTYKHMLLPVWHAPYSYRGKPYLYMVNGQTGRVAGTVPRSPWKITTFVLACLAAAALIYAWLSGAVGGGVGSGM